MNLELGLGACALFSFIFFCGFSLILWLIVAVKESLRDYDLDYGVIFVILIVLGIVMGTLTTYKLSGFTEQHPDSVEKKIITESLISLDGGYLKLEYPEYGGPTFMFCSSERGGQLLSVALCGVERLSSGLPRLETCEVTYKKKFLFFVFFVSTTNKTFFIP